MIDEYESIKRKQFELDEEFKEKERDIDEKFKAFKGVFIWCLFLFVIVTLFRVW